MTPTPIELEETMTNDVPKAGSRERPPEPDVLPIPDDGRFAMDFPEPILTLVTEIDDGASVVEAAQAMVDLARRTNAKVRATVEGTSLVVGPNDSAKSVVSRFEVSAFRRRAGRA